MNAMRLGCLCLCLWLPVTAAATSVAAAPVAVTEEQLAPIRVAMRELIRREMQAKEVAGLSLALVDDHKTLWAEGFGFASRDPPRAAQADTLYSTGSLSMLFTATAILQLAERGALNLDQPVRQVLPEFSPRSRFPQAPAITPRHLLANLSGLPGMIFKDMWTPNPESLASVVARLKDEYVAYPPRQLYTPSFPGYDVLGRLLELECHQPFADCMRNRLLQPLGMPRSTFDPDQADRARLAVHYWTKKPVASIRIRDLPAAGLISSVTELASFMRMMLADGMLDGRRILKPASVHAMLHVQNADVALDFDTQVGMPWRLSGVRLSSARQVAWMSNESPFSRGRLMLVPEQRLGVVVLANSSGATLAVEKISERLLELILQTRRLPAREPTLALKAAARPPARADILGHYATNLGLISVTAEGGNFRARMLGKTFALRRQGDGLLAAEYHLLGLIPIPIALLKEARLTTTQIGTQHVAVAYYRDQAHRLGVRLTPQPVPEAWRRRLGEYAVVERDPLLKLVKLENIALVMQDGLLCLRYRVPGWLGLVATIAVSPVNDRELVIAGSGWLMGETIQVGRHSGQETLRYSGYEFRRIADSPR